MHKPRVLITGCVSLLGKYLVKTLAPDAELVLTFHRTQPNHCFDRFRSRFVHLDTADKIQVEKLIKRIHPQFLIHLAAVSNIDFCEHHPRLTHKINVGGTVNICRSLTGSPIHLIFTSSNAVFDGNHAPFQESHLPRPLNVYGQTKYKAERVVLKGNFPHTIVRLSAMFGWQPKGARANDVTFYLKKLGQKHPLKLVTDRFFNPVYALRAAGAIKIIILRKHLGTFHVAGKSRVNRFLFVKSIKTAFAVKKHPPLIPVSNDFFPNLAPRPYDSTLATTKMEQVLKVVPKSLPAELRHMKTLVF